MTATTSLSRLAHRELADLSDRLIGPEDPDYDQARAVHNGMIDRHPALIVPCANADEVARTIAFARRHGVPIAVRGGGHNGGGLGVVDDGVVIDLAGISDVEVIPQSNIVRVGGGATWGQVDRATAEHGCVVPSGIISTTGVGGLTLGGGMGHLTRRFGLTIDNLVGADVVLADGSQVHTDAHQHPDLFWALRGGGGNFGVVTAFEFRTHPLGATVMAGPTFWPMEQLPEVMRFYREFLPAAPRNLNGFFASMTVPPVDLFPAELHMRKVCGIFWCITGSEADAAELLAPVHEVGTPLLHGVGPIPHPDLQSLFDGLYVKGLQCYWRADFVNELPDALIAKHLEWSEKLPSMHSTMHLYPISGAAHDVGASDTAFNYRDTQWAEVIFGVDPDPARAGDMRDWCVGYWDATHPYSAGGAYVNFMMDEGQERVKATYRDNYDRLAQVKAAYDPDNVFHVNQNIQPASVPAPSA
ncbi:MAG: FAD-binding oxidoreductase [Solirubrobacteraceae bacterium]